VATAQTVHQRYLITQGGFVNKVETLARILEAESFDGVLIFVRTKVQTVELAEKLSSRGFSVAPLNGDIPQNLRLRTVDQLKSKKIDILVATDVAARGLDVERVSHVINFDIPFDTESYIHRIGRTGRAGRSGEAILLVNPRERSMLRSIERATRQKISPMTLPTVEDINKKRITAFKDGLQQEMLSDTELYEKVLREFLAETQEDLMQVAAALVKMSQNGQSLLLSESNLDREYSRKEKRQGKGQPSHNKSNKEHKKNSLQLPPEEGLERFRIDLGDRHGVKPGNIVGAIANEAEIDSSYIGRINIFDDYSTVDLPYGMPGETLQLLKRVRIGSRSMKMQRIGEATSTRISEDNTPALRVRKDKKKKLKRRADRRAQQ